MVTEEEHGRQSLNSTDGFHSLTMLLLDWSYVLDGMQLASIYIWLDDIPFNREKRKLSRDFSDGGINSL